MKKRIEIRVLKQRLKEIANTSYYGFLSLLSPLSFAGEFCVRVKVPSNDYRRAWPK